MNHLQGQALPNRQFFHPGWPSYSSWLLINTSFSIGRNERAGHCSRMQVLASRAAPGPPSAGTLGGRRFVVGLDGSVAPSQIRPFHRAVGHSLLPKGNGPRNAGGEQVPILERVGESMIRGDGRGGRGAMIPIVRIVLDSVAQDPGRQPPDGQQMLQKKITITRHCYSYT
jgi:hypothetical protein